MKFRWKRLSGLGLFLLAGCAGGTAREQADSGEHEGLVVYRKLCIECHGENGEGNATEEVDALYGQRSVASLARFIERNMPEDEPELCVGKEARSVAQYIHDAFYSPAARKRLGSERCAIEEICDCDGCGGHGCGGLVERSQGRLPVLSFDHGTTPGTEVARPLRRSCDGRQSICSVETLRHLAAPMVDVGVPLAHRLRVG